MIKGNKHEPVINTTISCKLMRIPDWLLICSASSWEEAHVRLRELQQQLSHSYTGI